MSESTTELRASLEGAAKVVRAFSGRVPRVALVLGSGLGAWADEIDDAVRIPYEEIPGIPSSEVKGHAGNLVLGTKQGVPVVAMQGRAHLYEGHSAQEIVFGTRLMLTLGAETLFITNAAGGIDPAFSPGDLMLIEDHLNFTGDNCLRGENDDSLGARFPDMTRAYDRDLGALADEVAAADGYTLQRGVYAGLLGPTYETPAEIRMLQTLGANAVGMSTVLEVIAARHMGARILGVSCITNLAAGISKTELSHDEVKETAERVRDRFVGLLSGVLVKLGDA
ncbi:MAG: purine-nucleoside phosphorylase [Deltaproteobacteria bacterium]|nr:purine-nucleoside phosphorylase [Deltaproteobacteria bacterium]